MNRQIAMGWERGRNIGFVQGFALATVVSAVLIAVVLIIK